MASMRIAWIGAGKMGLPICKRLKTAGHDVRVLARRPEQEEKLRAHGFAIERTVADLIGDTAIVFTCVSDDQALSNVVLNNAFQTALCSGSTLIDMSTVSPGISVKISESIPKGVAYLRSPVSGSTAMAEAGTLTALVSGPKTAFIQLADLFAVFTKKAFHLGPAEEARYLKLAINSMVAATAALLGEALAFGRKGGLSDEIMLEVITQSAVASPLIGYKKDMIVNGDYKAAATLNMLMKDLDLFLASGKTQGTPLPVNEMIKGIYAAAAARGLGEQDFFVLVKEARRDAETTPR
jgi:3-hydroxyisobutyrate dehydrogenase-like beta-hydroxyacid dehydrogenase